MNIDTRQWTQGPNLGVQSTREPAGRHGLKCSLLTKPFPQIVIVGGRNEVDGRGNKRTNRVEIINLETGEMTQGKE